MSTPAPWREWRIVRWWRCHDCRRDRASGSVKPGDQPLSPEIFEFWLKSDPTCPVKATAEGGLLIFLANDYAVEIPTGGRIGCRKPDSYQFRDITLINGMPMEGNTADCERPGAP